MYEEYTQVVFFIVVRLSFLPSSSFSLVQDTDLPPLDEEVLGGKFDSEKAIEAAAAAGSPSKPSKGKEKKGSSSRMESIMHNIRRPASVLFISCVGSKACC